MGRQKWPKAESSHVSESDLDLSAIGGSLGLTSQVTGTLPIANGGTGGANAGAARTALGLAIGTDVQAYDADLDAISALAKTDGGIIVGNGSAFVLESGATARTSLGLGTGDTPTFNGAAMGAAAITGVADPSNDQDAATKKYVDDNTGAGGTSVGRPIGTPTVISTKFNHFVCSNGICESRRSSDQKELDGVHSKSTNT